MPTGNRQTALAGFRGPWSNWPEFGSVDTAKGTDMFEGMLGNCTVSDLGRAERWFALLFERGPDRRPMDGLLEWHLGPGFGLQVWLEPERSGHSTVVLEVADLQAVATRLAAAGLDHHGPEQGGGGQLVQLADPDGNRIVLAGPGVLPRP